MNEERHAPNYPTDRHESGREADGRLREEPAPVPLSQETRDWMDAMLARMEPGQAAWLRDMLGIHWRLIDLLDALVRSGDYVRRSDDDWDAKNERLVRRLLTKPSQNQASARD